MIKSRLLAAVEFIQSLTSRYLVHFPVEYDLTLFVIF